MMNNLLKAMKNQGIKKRDEKLKKHQNNVEIGSVVLYQKKCIEGNMGLHENLLYIFLAKYRQNNKYYIHRL
jgi:hypothetical protein